MLSFPDVDTRDPRAVGGRIRAIMRGIAPQGDLELFDRVFDDVGRMFRGEFGDYRPIDLQYHDYQHTLQASLCMAELIAGRERVGATPILSWREIQLGMTAVLMHDTGYLTTASDGEGTGAKFTYTHVLRSAAVAASQLPRYGVKPKEVDIVLNAIRCTGPSADINQLDHHNESELILGACVTTADYLGQMAAQDYPEELDILYNEFRESDDYQGVPQSDRKFLSTDDLIRHTPIFWRDFVLPKLEKDFRGVYRYLAAPFPDGPNPYLAAIERNMEIIEARGTTLAPKAASI
jgi:hypothetical protein